MNAIKGMAFQGVARGFLLLMAGFMLLPFMWIISTSFRLPQESFSLPPAFFPTSFRVDNYRQVFTEFPFTAFILNSTIVTGVVVIGHVLFSSMAAYAFARIRFPGRDLIFIVFLSGLMIPIQVTIIPLYIFLAKLGLVDTQAALILPALINPLGIFLIRQLMLTIPFSYDEAAYMDGAGRFQVFLKIILPMSMPAVSTSSVLWFIAQWNDYFRPLIFINTYEKMTLPIGMTVLKGEYGSGNLSAIMAGVTVSLIAPLIFYIVGQKYLMNGIRAGGLKG